MINKCKIINEINHVNGFKDKNYLVSVSAEKVFEKIQHSFQINVLGRLWLEGTYLYIMKAI